MGGRSTASKLFTLVALAVLGLLAVPGLAQAGPAGPRSARRDRRWPSSTAGSRSCPSCRPAPARYFSGGVAFHAYPEVPVYPASHGCVRVPPFAQELFDFGTLGTRVVVL